MVDIKAIAGETFNVVRWPARKADGAVIRALHIGGPLADDNSKTRRVVDSAVTAVPVVAAADYALGPNISIIRPVVHAIASVPGIEQVVGFYANNAGVAVPATILAAGAAAIGGDVYRRIKAHTFSRARSRVRLGLELAAYAALTFAVWNSASTMAINSNTARDDKQQHAIDSLTSAVENRAIDSDQYDAIRTLESRVGSAESAIKNVTADVANNTTQTGYNTANIETLSQNVSSQGITIVTLKNRVDQLYAAGAVSSTPVAVQPPYAPLDGLKAYSLTAAQFGQQFAKDKVGASAVFGQNPSDIEAKLNGKLEDGELVRFDIDAAAGKVYTIQKALVDGREKWYSVVLPGVKPGAVTAWVQGAYDRPQLDIIAAAGTK